MENALTKKMSKKTRIILLVVSLIFLAALLIVYWAPWKIKDEGYILIEQDIKTRLDTPTSFKLNSAYYKPDSSRYILNLSKYDRQYKISFSCKNGLDNTINVCLYYGYNTETHELYYYGTDSTQYSEATFDPVKLK